MKVDKRLMLLVDMTDGEAMACLRTAKKIVLNGIIDWQRPEIQLWMIEFCPFEGQRLLIASTALLQRLLLSYINHLELQETAQAERDAGEGL